MTTTTIKTLTDDQVKVPTSAPKPAPKPVTDGKSKLSWLGVH